MVTLNNTRAYGSASRPAPAPGCLAHSCSSSVGPPVLVRVSRCSPGKQGDTIRHAASVTEELEESTSSEVDRRADGVPPFLKRGGEPGTPVSGRPVSSQATVIRRQMIDRRQSKSYSAPLASHIRL